MIFSDINDSRPKFESAIYNVTIAENTLPEYLLKIRAIDADAGPNADLVYTLENDHNGLHKDTDIYGIIEILGSIDFS